MTINNIVREEVLVRSAFERVLPELRELREEDLQPISLDITSAVNTVLGVLKEVKALRPRMVTELPAFDVSQADKLEDYALALSHINKIYLGSAREKTDLEELAAEASKLRERHLAEVRALASYGLLDVSVLGQLKGGSARKSVAADLGVLAGILETAWPKIQGKTPSTLQDLENASRLSTLVGRILGEIEQGPAVVAEVAEQRVRAFTKLMGAYESVQLAVAFLRGKNYDADTIVPNLHPGRPGSRRKSEDTPSAPEEGVTPPAPASPPSASGTAPVAATTPAFAADAFGPGGPFMPVK